MDDKIATKFEKEAVLVPEPSHFQIAIKKLIDSGAQRLAPIRIKSIDVVEDDDYLRVSLTLSNNIPAFARQEDGSYKEILHNVIHTSSFAISAAIRENEDLAWLGNSLNDKPQTLKLILTGAAVKIIQQRIPANTSYINPFSTQKAQKSVVFTHDFIINHIVDFKLSATGEKMAGKLVDKLLGF